MSGAPLQPTGGFNKNGGVSSETSDLELGRAAFARRAWRDAYSHFAAAQNEPGFDFDDDLRRAAAAYLIGRDDESIQILSRAHEQAAEKRQSKRAVRAAFWLFFLLVNKGEMAPAGGWFMRGQRLAEELDPRCAEAALMLVPPALQTLFGGDPEAALPLFDRAIALALECDDADLYTLTHMGRAHALVDLGRTKEGIALFDEVMITAISDRVLPFVTGTAYCAMIELCHTSFDLRRAQEWTDALTQWCAAQPDLVPYRGQCLIHRAELMQLHGAWPDAIEEAVRAREQLMHAPDKAVIGKAVYQLGEVHRLQGDFDDAETAYRGASQWGHEPQPGLTLMRLARGDVAAARSAIDRLLQEAHGPHQRAKLLPAAVEVMIAGNDLDAARYAADELRDAAEEIDAPYVTALASSASGSVLLKEGDPGRALSQSRAAWELWRQLDVPYEAARVRVLIGLACRELGDEDAAQMELDAARWSFEQLGAAPEIERVEKLLDRSPPSPTEGLTGREVEVLALVATGKTNREIAGQLVISEKTVARHLSNIFVKIGVSSRSAATAYAFQHDLA